MDYTNPLTIGNCCEDCGDFISAKPAKQPAQCQSCHEDELIRAVETDVWPDEMEHSEWLDTKRQYAQKNR